jgi:hypothetical protein
MHTVARSCGTPTNLMAFRVVAGIVLAGAVAAAQPRMERVDAGRVPRDRFAPMVAASAVGGTIVPVNGRRTTVVRLTTISDARALGFTVSQLEAFGVFATGGVAANAVVGYARDSAAHVLPGAATQLRDLGRGLIVGHARTNPGGQFAFPGLPPGTYIVELLSPTGRVVALSDALSVGAGELVQTIVQMTAPTRSFTSWVGGATATAVNSAVDAGVLAIQSAPAVSPES